MSNENLKESMLNKRNWAVIGVSPNKEKIAYKIFENLIENGYNAYCVNPNYDEIEEGVKSYHSLEEIPIKPDCIDFVVPPQITKNIIEEISPNFVKNLWMQPGTYNDEVVNLALNKGFDVVAGGDCLMVALTLKNE